MQPKPNPADFTHHGELQQPHYDNAVRAWEKLERMEQNEEKATCRGCGKVLKGNPYYMGGSAYDIRTGKQCKVNHYGGFVCSEDCDRKASLELERTMPGHSYNQTSLSSFASRSIKNNWD